MKSGLDVNAPLCPQPDPTPDGFWAQPTYEQLMSRALAFDVQGRKSDAVAQLRAAAKVRPEAAAPYEKLCTLLYSTGELKLALAACEGWMEREKSRLRHGQIRGLVAVLSKRLAVK